MFYCLEFSSVVFCCQQRCSIELLTRAAQLAEGVEWRESRQWPEKTAELEGKLGNSTNSPFPLFLFHSDMLSIFPPGCFSSFLLSPASPLKTFNYIFSPSSVLLFSGSVCISRWRVKAFIPSITDCTSEKQHCENQSRLELIHELIKNQSHPLGLWFDVIWHRLSQGFKEPFCLYNMKNVKVAVFNFFG